MVGFLPVSTIPSHTLATTYYVLQLKRGDYVSALRYCNGNHCVCSIRDDLVVLVFSL